MMKLMKLSLLSVACLLWHAAFVRTAPVQSEGDPLGWYIAVPRVLTTTSEHTIIVEDLSSSSRSAVLTINSLYLTKGKTNEGTPKVIRDGQGSVQYRIPFDNFIDKTLNVTFSLAECSGATCNPGKTILERQVTLPVVEKTLMVFIETSKPIYKPGETVKFRLLPITPESLKPSPFRFDLVYLQSPNKMRMAQWMNVTWIEALRGLNFSLSADPMFGKWRIVATIGDVKDEEEFKVAKYVLPRFTVSINPPSTVYAKDKFVQFEVCPKYSTGLPMKATIKAKLCIRPKEKSYKMDRPCISVSNKTDGISPCKAFNVSTQTFDLLNSSYSIWNNFVIINASVAEQDTNQTVNKTEYGGKLEISPYKIVVDCPKTFNPKLPFYGRVKTVNNDDTPRPNVRLVISVSQFWNGWGFKKEFTSNNDGIIDFSIPPFPESLSSISISFQDKMKKRNEPYRRGRVSLRLPSSWHNVRNTFSPSDTFMQAVPLNRMKAQDPCGTGKLKILLQGTVPLQDKVIKVIASSRTGMRTIQSVAAVQSMKDSCQDADTDEIGHFVCVPSVKPGEIPQIRCRKGWQGPNCRAPVCTDGCFKGVCLQPDVCSCQRGWSGPTCSDCNRRKGCKNGCCSYGDDCRCYIGYTGHLCTKTTTRKRRAPICAKDTKRKASPFAYDPTKLQGLSLFTREVTIDISDRLYPSARLALWFTHQGPNQTEFVATSVDLPNLKSCLDKSTPTSVQFDARTVRPGQSTTATVKTTGKDAKCALAISDIALETFGTRGGVSQAQLSSDLDELFKKIAGEWVYNDWYRQLKNERCPVGKRPRILDRRQKRKVLSYAPAKSDSSTVFKSAGILMLADFPIVTAPCEEDRNRRVYFKGGQGRGDHRNLVADLTVAESDKKASKALKTRLRSFFPETWIFDLFENPNSIPLKAPDSMTTWKATMYCVSSAGLGIAKSSQLTVFQPFYLQIAMPYSLIRGEAAKIPVKVFSYLKECIEIELTMKPSAALDSNGEQRAVGCLCNFQQSTAYFRVKPKTLGRVPIEVHAQSRASDRCGGKFKRSKREAKKSKKQSLTVTDAVRRNLLVEPEGLPEQMSFGDLFCPSKGSKSGTFSVQPPTDMKVVSESARAYVTWTGSVFGSSLENLDQIVRVPYGCGEQNIMSMVPSIYVLDFFTNAGIKKPDVTSRATKYIGMGYQRQMNYRLKDGSYSAFGERDINGSTWLTAFVLKSFVAASRYSDIDRKVLTSALSFLMSKAGEDGCFREDGRVFSSSLKGGISQEADTVSITAYILSAMVEVRETDKALVNATAPGIAAAIKCLVNSTNSTGVKSLPTYAVAIRAYALRNSGLPLLLQYRAELDSRVTKDKGFVYWRGGISDSKKGKRSWYRYTSADVETTAYALLSRLEEIRQGNGDLVSVLPTIRWLTSQRNERGGWYSTQDTVMGLQALTSMGTGLSSGSVELKIATEKKEKTATINKDNSLVLSQMPVAVPSTLTVTAKGSGCAVVQTNLFFNVLDIGRPDAPFTLKAKSSQKKGACEESKLELCVRYTGTGRQSGMAVVKVRMASGWRVPVEEQERLIDGTLKRADTEKDDSVLVLYFDYFSAKDTCISLALERQFEVSPLQPMLVQVFDYYRPDQTQEKSVDVVTPTCRNEPKKGEGKACPFCSTGNSSEAAVSRMCSKPNYFVEASRKTADSKTWDISYPSADIIMLWRGALSIPKTCKCPLGRRVIAGVREQYWQIKTDEDLIVDDLWTVVDVDKLSNKGLKMFSDSCVNKANEYQFELSRESKAETPKDTKKKE